MFWYLDGLCYEGGWVEDCRNGYGIYIYVNGDIYEGDWYEYQCYGYGIYIYLVSGIKYMGFWVYGKWDGMGELIYFNYRYVGNFVDDNF